MGFVFVRRARNTFLRSSRPCHVPWCPLYARLVRVSRFSWGRRGLYSCPVGHVRRIDRHR